MTLRQWMKLGLATSALTMSAAAQAQWSTIEGMPRPSNMSFLTETFTREQWNASNFAPPEDVSNFQDMRFGLMVSFGVTVLGQQELSWGEIGANERKAPDGNALSDGHSLPMAAWTRWDQQLRMERFNAHEWVRFAQEAGFRYIVIIAKHHDGFHQWDTAFSDYRITNTPFGRDYLKEIIDACHEAGMPIGIYYSQRDWHHPDYSPTGFGPNHDQPGPTHQRYIDYQFNVVRELLTKYGRIDIFWFDALWWGGMFRERDWDAERLTRMVRELQPHIVINNRTSVPGDFDTPEQRMGVFQTWRPWEAAVSLEETWSYSGRRPKSARDVTQLLARTAFNNGNLILSLGPLWSGEFDPGEMQTMREVGSWLHSYGQSIYATRGGPWKPAAWGGSTWHGSTAYLHVLDQAQTSVGVRSIPGNRVRRASLLATDASGRTIERPLRFTETGGQITVSLPAGTGNPADTVIKLDMARSLAGVTPLEPLSESMQHQTAAPFDYELVYGQRVGGDTAVTSSGFAVPLTNAVRASLLLGTGGHDFSVATTSAPGSWIQVDLGSTQQVTGVYLDAAVGDAPLEVALSNDGATFSSIWTSTSTSAGQRAPWEIEVNEMKAGAITPGRNVRYIRVRLANAATGTLNVRNLGVWVKHDN